jgi:hypothetical protein
MMPIFYKLGNSWPDGFASVIIHPAPGFYTNPLDVYKGLCGPDYVRNFRVTDYHPGHCPDVFPNNSSWLIVSPRGRAVFEAAGGQIGAFFTSITDLSGENTPSVLEGYSLASASHVFDCLDLTSPNLTWFDPSQKLVKVSYGKLPLLVGKIPEGANFFGVKRDPSIYVVSAKLRQSILDAELSGIRFEECQSSVSATPSVS